MSGSLTINRMFFRRLASNPREVSALIPGGTLEEYYPVLKRHLASEGLALPAYVEQEFEC